jgi:nicotinic acid phosphoribosyltransferase
MGRLGNMSNNWRERMAVTVSSMERRIAIRLDSDHIRYLTQEPLCITTCDFYFPTIPRPLVVFIDGPPHLAEAQMVKDEVFRTAIRKAGYKVLELPYSSNTDKSLNELYQSIRDELARLGHSD